MLQTVFLLLWCCASDEENTCLGCDKLGMFRIRTILCCLSAFHLERNMKIRSSEGSFFFSVMDLYKECSFRASPLKDLISLK